MFRNDEEKADVNSVSETRQKQIIRIREVLTCPVSKTLLQAPLIGVECHHVFSQPVAAADQIKINSRNVAKKSGFDKCPINSCSDSDKSKSFYVLKDVLAAMDLDRCFSRQGGPAEIEIYDHCKNFSNEKFKEILELLRCPILTDILIDPIVLISCGHTYERGGVASNGGRCALCQVKYTSDDIIDAPILLEIIQWLSLFAPRLFAEEYSTAYEPGKIATLLAKNDARQIANFIAIMSKFPFLLNNIRHKIFLDNAEDNANVPLYSLLMMLASSPKGLKIIVENPQLRDSISITGLNDRVSSLSLKFEGYSALHFFLKVYKGCVIFVNDTKLRDKIDLSNFTTHSRLMLSPCAQACFYASGLEMLQIDARLRSSISNNILNDVFIISRQNNRDDKLSILALLVNHQIGIDILSNDEILRCNIEPRSLSMLPECQELSAYPNGYSILMALVSNSQGRNLIETDPSLRSKITSDSMDIINAEGISALLIYLYHNVNIANINIFLQDDRLRGLITSSLLASSISSSKITVLFLLTYKKENIDFIVNDSELRSKLSTAQLIQKILTPDTHYGSEIVGYSPLLNLIKHNKVRLLNELSINEILFKEAISALPSVTQPTMICSLLILVSSYEGLEFLKKNIEHCHLITENQLNYSTVDGDSPLKMMLQTPVGLVLLRDNHILCNRISSDNLFNIVTAPFCFKLLHQEKSDIVLLRDSIVFRSKLTTKLLSYEIALGDGIISIFQYLLKAQYKFILKALTENPELAIDFYEDLTQNDLKYLQEQNIYFPSRANPIVREDQIFLLHFINLYLYDHSITILPRDNGMLNSIKNGELTHQYLINYGNSNPDSRSRKIIHALQSRARDTKKLNTFYQLYINSYKSTLFTNPFSQMKNNIAMLTSVDELDKYIDQHPNSRSKKLFNNF